MTTLSPLIATGSGSDLGFQAEVSAGQLPAAPALRVFPRVSTTLALSKEAYQSEQVRSDRQVIDSRHGIRSVAGDVTTEIAPGTHAEAYEALMGGIWTAPAGLTLSAPNNIAVNVAAAEDLNAATLTLAGALTWPLSPFKIGDTITITGSGNANINGMHYTITGFTSGAVATARSIRPYAGVVNTPVSLTAGVVALMGRRVSMGNIYRSFVFERAFIDIGSYLVFRGMRFNSAAIDLPPTGIATSTFGLMGLDANPLAAASFDGPAASVLTQATLTSLNFNAAARTITAAAGSFLTAGFAVGDRVIFTGTGIIHPQNRNVRTITAVTTTVMTVAEPIQNSGSAYTGTFSVTKVSPPDYTQAAFSQVLVAVSGVLLVNGVSVGTVTAASLNIDNGMGGANVVGRNVKPALLWGTQVNVSGSLTVLFDRGGMGETIYNAFDLEQEMSLVLRLDSSDGANFVTFNMPRIKINSGNIGDAVAEGLPVTAEFIALKPSNVNMPDSTIVIQDSTL